MAAMRVGRPLFFRRREVWVPTAWSLLLLAGGVLLALALLGWKAYALLAPDAPAEGPDGRGAHTLVVEGWMVPAELDRVVEHFDPRQYRRVLTSGGPIEPWLDAGGWGNYAVRAAAHLRARLPAGVTVTPVPAPETQQERTYVSAVRVREWIKASGEPIPAIDLVTTGVHARRSWMLYRMAFRGAAEVGIRSALPAQFDGRHWWRSSAAAKTMIGEAMSVVWTSCCFWPGAPGSADELAGEAGAAN